MQEGVWKYYSNHFHFELTGEFPCAPENQALIDSLTAYYTNATNILSDFRGIQPPMGEGFTLTAEYTTPAQAPTWFAELPLEPSMLPAPNYPFNEVIPAEYTVLDYTTLPTSITLPTPETMTLLIIVFIVLVITELKEKYDIQGVFVPLFFEPHLLLTLLLSKVGRKDLICLRN